MRTELSIRAKNELEGFDAITATLIRGWIIRHLLPLDNPKTTGTSLGGSKRWQYRIGDYRLLCRVSEKHTWTRTTITGFLDGTEISDGYLALTIFHGYGQGHPLKSPCKEKEVHALFPSSPQQHRRRISYVCHRP